MNENEAQPAPGTGAKPKASGAGPDGTIPVSDQGISLTTTDDGSNFNQEEDAGGAPDGSDQPTPET